MLERFLNFLVEAATRLRDHFYPPFHAENITLEALEILHNELKFEPFFSKHSETPAKH